MKFAIAIPQFYADGEFDPTSFREYLARAEELGFEIVTYSEHHFYTEGMEAGATITGASRGRLTS